MTSSSSSSPPPPASMSFTALQFTEKELQNERAAMSATETARIQQEIRGFCRTTTPEEEEETTETTTFFSLQQFQKVMETNVPLQHKQDYLRALQVCPDLVRIESNPELFWRYYHHYHHCNDSSTSDNNNNIDNNNDNIMTAAALRLCQFWKTRCELFQENAFRPLRLMPEDDDIRTDRLRQRQRQGSMQLLPVDTAGRPVLYIRRADINFNTMDRPRVLRTMFYLLWLASRDEKQQKRGIVLVMDGQGVGLENSDRKLTAKVMDIWKHSSPIQIRAIHCCFPCQKCVARLFFPLALWLLGESLRKRICIHSNGGPKEFLFDLTSYGMKKEHLPPGVGGTLELARYQEWLDRHHQRRGGTTNAATNVSATLAAAAVTVVESPQQQEQQQQQQPQPQP